jgi:UDP-glucose 4-epimerase
MVEVDRTALEGRRALITGGAGMIGSTIADRLLELGVAEVVVLDNFTRGRKENLDVAIASDRVTLVEGDIRDRSLLVEALDGVDIVFHQAAIRITQCDEDPRLALEVLVDGTFNVFEAASNAGVRRLVAASSASVYGQAEVLPTPESHHPYANRTFYGAAKAFSEGMLRSLHDLRDLDYVALRYFNVYGPRMDVHGVYTEVLVRWMERIERGEPPVVFGDGSETMDLVYVDDVARANVLAALAPVTDRVYNVGRGEAVSLLGVAEALVGAMGSNLRPTLRPSSGRPAVAHRLADTAAARADLGFEANVGLDEGLRRLVGWWRAERGTDIP